MHGTSHKQSYESTNISVYDSSGVILWSDSLKGSSSLNVIGNGAFEDINEDIIVVGHWEKTEYSSGDVWVVKYNELGEKLWKKEFETKVEETVTDSFLSDGKNLVVMGTSKGEPYAINMDIDGEILWEKTYSLLYFTGLLSIHEFSDEGFLVAGQVFDTENLEKNNHCFAEQMECFYNGNIRCNAQNNCFNTSNGCSDICESEKPETVIIKFDQNGNCFNCF